MKITIEGDPKEIAALVLEIQERQSALQGALQGSDLYLALRKDAWDAIRKRGIKK